MKQEETEQRLPTTDEMIKFTEEQIKVRKVQLELQKLNTELAKLKHEEVLAFSQIAYYNKPDTSKKEEVFDHVVTQEDLDLNPELAGNGIKVGDTVQIPKSE